MLKPLPMGVTLDTYVEGKDLVVAYFFRRGCGVCEVLKPRIAALIDQHEIYGVSVDVNERPEEGGQRLVLTVPTLLVIIEGKEAQRLSRHFSPSALDDTLKRFLSLMR